MAGIGFRINAYIERGNSAQKTLGAIAAIFVAAGPAVCIILAMAFVSIFHFVMFGSDKVLEINALITFSFMLAMILYAPLEILTQKFVADMIFYRNEKVLGSLYVLQMAIAAAISTLGALVLFVPSGLDWRSIIAFMALLVAIMTSRIAISFLSATRGFTIIAAVFFGGIMVSVVASSLLGYATRGSTIPTLLGFTLGQILTAWVLSVIILKNFTLEFHFPLNYGSYCRRHLSLIVIGLSLAGSFWIDKMIYWYLPGMGKHIMGPIYTFLPYDLPVVIGFIHTIPLLGYFIVKIETSFFIPLRHYLALLEKGATYGAVDAERIALVRNFWRGFSGLFVVQGLFSLLCLIGFGYYRRFMEFDISFLEFAIPVIAISLYVVAMLLFTLALYLDKAREVAKISAGQFAVNGVLTLILHRMGDIPHGTAALFGSLTAVILATWLLARTLHDLHFQVLFTFRRNESVL